MPPPLVLYSVLDWGLGHATRSIPVIRQLLRSGHRVVIAAEGRSLELLRQEFPELPFETISGFRVRYPEKGMALWLLGSLPLLYKALKAERQQTSELCRKWKPDFLISDHRYGFTHKAYPSVFIGHQLKIQAGFCTGLLYRLHLLLLRKFTAVWVPDKDGESNLSGKLSHGTMIDQDLHPLYIGPQTRLSEILTISPVRKYDILVLLSGPEPQRTLLEQLCIRQLSRSGKQVIIIQGKPEETAEQQSGNITLMPSLPAAKLKGLLIGTPVIICRPGYSTLMDLDHCGRNAILIPTPGQTEQEYLGKRMQAKTCLLLNQENADLVASLEKFQPVFGEIKSTDNEATAAAIAGLRFLK